MENELKANLLALGAAFLAATELAPATMWMRAAKDARFGDRIGAGASFTARVYDNVVSWFDRNWPEGAIWPEAVARPSAKSEAAE